MDIESSKMGSGADGVIDHVPFGREMQGRVEPGGGVGTQTASRVVSTKGVVIGLMLSLFLAALDSTIMSTAMPLISADLGGFEHYHWPFTSYLLSCTVATLLCGGLSSVVGHRRLFVSGLVLFCISSILCATSGSVEMLALWRLFEGLGGGLVEACVFIAAADLFEPRERGRYMGIITSVYGIASVAGPLLGGAIAQVSGWQWVFLINVPLGIAALAAVGRFLPAHPAADRVSLDGRGAFFAVLAVVPLVLAFSLAGDVFAIPSAPFVLMIVLSVAFMGVLCAVERGRSHAIVPIGLFRKPVMNAAFAFGFSTQFALLAAIVTLPRFLQQALGADALSSGLALTALVVALMVGSNLAGMMFRRNGRMRLPAMVSCGITAAASLALSQLEMFSSMPYTVVVGAVLGLGVGMGMPLSNIAAQVSADPRDVGKATSMVLFFRGLGGTVATAVVGAIGVASNSLGIVPSFATVAVVSCAAAFICIVMPLHIERGNGRLTKPIE